MDPVDPVDFSLKLEDEPTKIAEETVHVGKKVVELLHKAQTYGHWDILQAFPADYRSGQQQDVTETIRFVFDQLVQSRPKRVAACQPCRSCLRSA